MKNLKTYFNNLLNSGTLIFLASMWLIFSCSAKEGYKIESQVKGYSQDTLAYLVEYRAQNQYMADTSEIDAEGNFTFQSDERLEPGMYFVVIPGQSHLDLIIDDEQHFSFTAEMDKLAETIQFESSANNTLYYEYLSYLREKRTHANELQEKFQQTDDEDEQEKIREELNDIDKEVREFQESFAEDNSDRFVSDFIYLTLEPQIPDDIEPNSREAYEYYKSNYFRNVNFGDERIVRTPIIHNKVERYFNQVVPKNPDSVIKEADKLIEQAKGSDDMFRYLVHYITSTYEQSDIMGMDAVFVHMANNYYTLEDAFWMSEQQIESINERAKALEPTLIGKTAPDIGMRTLNGGNKSLSDFDAEYTVIYFWDYDCGHCRRVTPDLYETYLEYRDKGIEVFAVCTQRNMEKWRDYILENDIVEWTNGIDPYHESGFRDKYDIYSTPRVFIVDKEREIVAKDIAVSQVGDLLGRLLQEDDAPLEGVQGEQQEQQQEIGH